MDTCLFELPSHPFCDLAVRFLEYASHQLSRLPLIGKMITGICLDETELLGPRQMTSQCSINLSQILDPTPLADLEAFFDALQVYQAENFFTCGSSIESKNIRCLEIIVVNSALVKRLEQACQRSQHNPS
jgi:hypothetical protein